MVLITKIVKDSANSHIGTSNGIRVIMEMGDVNGIIDNQKATGRQDYRVW